MAARFERNDRLGGQVFGWTHSNTVRAASTPSPATFISRTGEMGRRIRVLARDDGGTWDTEGSNDRDEIHGTG